jgi:hypothetical protein
MKFTVYTCDMPGCKSERFDGQEGKRWHHIPGPGDSKMDICPKCWEKNKEEKAK